MSEIWPEWILDGGKYQNECYLITFISLIKDISADEYSDDDFRII